jgi:hypothetical protein
LEVFKKEVSSFGLEPEGVEMLKKLKLALKQQSEQVRQ